MDNKSKKTDSKKPKEEDSAVTIKDFGELGRITKENLDSVFENDLTALARRRRRKD